MTIGFQPPKGKNCPEPPNRHGLLRVWRRVFPQSQQDVFQYIH